MMMKFVPICFLLTLLLLAACAETEETAVSINTTPVSTATAEKTAVSPSPLPPTSTPIPTETASPTATTPPTATAMPSPTVTPSPTPLPTATVPPTPTPYPTAVPQPASIPLSDIAAYMGEEVTVSGQVTAVSSFSSGFKFTLSDGNGRLTLLMWHGVYDDCWDAPQLNVGATVQATGDVGEYEGALQITPNFGGDVKVLTAGAASATQSAIGDLGNHVDERVTITGAIVRVEGAGAGTKLFIADETGEVLVFVWQNILDRVPQNTALGVPGTRVRVTGWVQLYRDNREIVPVLPYDVVVLP